MKRLLRWLGFAVVAVLAAGVFKSINGAGVDTPVVEPAGQAVRVGEVIMGPIQQEARMIGEVEALAEVYLAPKVSGRLIRLDVQEGERVRKGEVVAVIDSDAFRAEIRHAEAAVAVAEAGLKAAEAARDNARLEHERTGRLFQQGAAPESSRDNADAAFRGATANVAVATAELERARAALELARINLDESTVKAPFDAVVAQTLLDPGALVSPGRAVVRLVSVDTVKVTAAVAERYLGDLVEGATIARVTVDALGGREFTGILKRISPVLDAATRTARVDIHIPNPSHALKPGMYARVTLVTRERCSAVLVPNDAVLGREGSQYVFVVEDATARRRRMTGGLWGAQFTEVLEGLAQGELVVTSGGGNLFDGARVEIEER